MKRNSTTVDTTLAAIIFGAAVLLSHMATAQGDAVGAGVGIALNDTSVVAPEPTASTAMQPTSTTTASCAAQTVFDQCKQNEDNYLHTCKQEDYACLCRWQTAKVSCWDTCPEDTEKEAQKSLMTSYCSHPGANVTVSTSSWLPISSSVVSSVASTTNAVIPPTAGPTTSSASGFATSYASQAVFTSGIASCLGILAGLYMLQ
ncbi:hypothetical protein BX666DRAFT_1893012 [Dichotomocladium elegans]|nr:hypothetical protein BX666DRAFT_1893012 [Dichotomocladium elegans]